MFLDASTHPFETKRIPMDILSMCQSNCTSKAAIALRKLGSSGNVIRKLFQ